MFHIIAQGIGLVAMAFNILSYQQKKKSTVIAFQFFGALFFSVNFFMIGGTIGGILNVVAAIRAVIFLNKERFRTDHIAWQIGFFLVFIASYVATFAVFKTPFDLYHAFVELLPVVGLGATTISFRYKDAAVIRKFALISSPSWLIYNFVNFTLGGIACEVLSLISVFIGMARLDRKEKGE